METIEKIESTQGRPMLNEGEKYAGVLLGKDGAPDQHIILLPGDSNDASWKKQTEWAKSVGGELPTRREHTLLFANLPEEFKRDVYWSGETHAADSSYAWYQDFDYGYQDDNYKDRELRARAVRRVAI
ncbi:MAG TPA: hypothetical protein VFS17_06815 [Methylophilaceae bacterium]|nr:hypothetical protein [Methylophilaceae bacterium]